MRSHRRHLTFAALLAALVVLGCEVLSWVGLSLVERRVATWGRMAGWRAAVAGGDLVASELGELPADTGDGNNTAGTGAGRFKLPRRHRDEQALHPFLGFVMDPERHPAAKRYGALSDAVELGFPWNTEPVFAPQNPNRFVVAILGGSVAVGLVQEQREPLRQAFAKLAGPRPVAILNLANYGYKQPQQLATLNYFLALGAKLDVVVNLDGFNEVALPLAESVPQGAFVYYPQSWIARVAANDPELRAKTDALAASRGGRKARAESFSARPWRWSFTTGALWRVLDNTAARRELALEDELAHWDAARLGYAARGPRLGGTTAATALPEIAALWQRSSWQMFLLCQGLGIRYFHFLQPNQYDPGSKPLSRQEREQFYQADHPYRPGVETGYPLLRQAGAELASRGVMFTDLSRLFASTSETVYSDVCCHFNSRGNALLASAIGAAVGGAAIGGATLTTPSERTSP